MRTLMLLFLLLSLVFNSGCRSSSGGSDGETLPVLQNLVVNLGVDGVDPDGAFVVSNSKDFLEFGAEVPDAGGGTKILPTFEYRVRSDADVVSPMDGIITRLEYQADSNDWAVWIQTRAGAEWLVEIDHVLDLPDDISVGDSITAGDLLGKPGTWGGGQGRVELLITDGSHYHCPFTLMDPELIDDYRAQLTALMNAIEAENNHAEPHYDQENMVEPGCNEWSYSD